MRLYWTAERWGPLLHAHAHALHWDATWLACEHARERQHWASVESRPRPKRNRAEERQCCVARAFRLSGVESRLHDLPLSKRGPASLKSP
jgi:hypothetical protein